MNEAVEARMRELERQLAEGDVVIAQSKGPLGRVFAEERLRVLGELNLLRLGSYADEKGGRGGAA